MSDKTDLALEILADVLEASPHEREAILDRACTTQSTLRAELERLLGLGPRAEEFLKVASPTDLVPSADPVQTPHIARFGRYRALRLIAEGGMGTVYEAQQDHPRRHVALKVIKPGMDTKQVIARFDAERETLALMDHPNIAAVYDAGATDAGRPFFAMELVKGVPITDYCDANTLAIRQRLDLFISVCRAVQHAHQKGIIHRDLKPSNVLVNVVDERPIPKIIDFGIAKATTGQRPAGQTLVTQHREFIGTPQYMSPEQAEMTGLDIDTRSDIYSLGVLLYELLTGATPFDRERFSQSNCDEVRRLIREVEPPRPSTRLSRLSSLPLQNDPSGTADAGQPRSSTTDIIAIARRTDSAALLRTLRGELDWIVMKCLEKDRSRRYQTANELAADLERYLCHEPVHAAPPTASYRLRKFAQRNRAALTAAALMLAFLLAGIIGTTIGLVRARKAEHRALEGQRKAEDLLQRVTRAETQARLDADQAAAINEFLLEMFQAPRPGWEGGGRNARVADVLEYAVTNLSRKFQGRPEAEIHARMALAVTYGHLARRDRCVENLSLAYDLARKQLGDDAALTLEIGGELSFWLAQNVPTRDQIDRAEAIARHVHATATAKPDGEANPHAHYAAHNMGWALIQKGEYHRAEEVYRRMLEVEARDPGAARIIGPGNAHHGLAWALYGQRRLDEAELHEREALREIAGDPVMRRFPRQHIPARRMMGLILAGQERFAEAAQVLREAIEFEDAMGHRNPAIERISNEYLNVLVRLDDFVRAAEFARHRLDLALADKPVDHALVADRTARLIGILDQAGRNDDAARLRGDYKAVLRTIIEQPADTAAALQRRGVAHAELGQFREAADDYAQAIELDPSQHDCWYFRGCVLAYLDDRAGYEDHCRRMLGRFGQATTRPVADRIAKTYLLVSRTDKECQAVMPLVDRALRGEQEGANLPWFRMLKGLAEYRAGRFDDALHWLNKTREDPPPGPHGVATMELLFAMTYHRLDHAPDARVAFDRARQIIEGEILWPDADHNDWVISRVILREARTLLFP
jgi:serine/threonine protein kinase